MDERNIFISHLWSIRNITRKLKSPRQPSINSPECENSTGARWSLSFFPYDRRIDDEEYTSFRLNLCTCPCPHSPQLDQSNFTVQLSLVYCTGVYIRRKTFHQRFTVKDRDSFTQVIFRYSTKALLRQLRRNKDDNLTNDTLQICVIVYFGDAPTDTSWQHHKSATNQVNSVRCASYTFLNEYRRKWLIHMRQRLCVFFVRSRC